jgi:hypothetical protein
VVYTSQSLLALVDEAPKDDGPPMSRRHEYEFIIYDKGEAYTMARDETNSQNNVSTTSKKHTMLRGAAMDRKESSKTRPEFTNSHLLDILPSTSQFKQ